ncbi:MAG: NAD(P)H-dependent oxidoreductase [Clostridiales bacterium]|nr:NAD(P)H-dependent oxidoreductase [Clostridiales bacterium]
MHVMIINGSPRTQELSNTDKIISHLVKGMKTEDKDLTTELYSISDRKQWDDAREAFKRNTEILIALPLYVECIPGLFLEFLDTLEKKDGNTRLSFVLQSGFAEASQLRCGEEYLKKLAPMLGCTYGGTLVKGDNFSCRFMPPEQSEKPLSAYDDMGASYIRNKGFDSDEARKFSGPEYFSAPFRVFLSIMFATAARFGFKMIAKGLGCTRPINDRPLRSDI